MKFAFSPIALLIIPAILGLPAIVPAEAAAAASPIEARTGISTVSGTITANHVAYRKCARTSCKRLGTFKKGAVVRVSCYIDKNTDVVNGDSRWLLGVSSGKKIWIPIGYVSTATGPPHC